MNNEISQIIDVPFALTVKIVRESGLGGVAGLDGGELADLDELERIAAFRLFEPLLSFGRNDSRWHEAARCWFNGRDAGDGLGGEARMCGVPPMVRGPRTQSQLRFLSKWLDCGCQAPWSRVTRSLTWLRRCSYE